MIVRAVSAAAPLYVAVLALLALLNRLLEQPPTWVALPTIFTPLWFLPLLFLAPLALFVPSTRLRGATAALSLLFVLLCGSWFVPHTTLGEGDVRLVNLKLVTLNLFATNGDRERIVTALRAQEADVIALQELSPEVATVLSTLPEFPYRALEPSGPAAHTPTSGLGLLSRYPLSAYVYDAGHRFQRAVVHLSGRRPTLFNVHAPTPFDSSPNLAESLPFSTVLSYDAGERGRVLAALLDLFAGTQGPLVVLGDFNLSDFEAAYREVAAQLTNVYRATTPGFGFTLSNRGRILPFPFLRIDHLWMGGSVRPAAVGVDCRPTGSDHCLLWGRVAFP